MQPPENAIETDAAFVWIDDGIIISQAKGDPITTESMSQGLSALAEATADGPHPLLFDARKFQRAELEAWLKFIDSIGRYFSRAAFLIDPDREPQFGGYPNVINQLLIPLEVFTDEDEALAFVRSGASSGERGLLS